MTVALTLRPLGDALGMEVLGMDLSRPLDDETFEAVDRAFAEHPVLVFRRQHLDAPALAALGSRFGRPEPHIIAEYRHPEHPMVSYIRNVDDKGAVDPYGVKRATRWHADETYNAALPRLAILHAVEVPSQRGGTMFADMRAAYDALPEKTKQRLDHLVARHGYTSGPDGMRLYGAEHAHRYDDTNPAQQHPAIKVHPASGRRVLFVNPMHTTGFIGVDEDEALGLIEELRDHATQDRFVYYHAWQVGDVLMWDELATMHRGAGDSQPDERRVMLRTIVHPN